MQVSRFQMSWSVLAFGIVALQAAIAYAAVIGN
jgi:hypothetical protein